MMKWYVTKPEISFRHTIWLQPTILKNQRLSLMRHRHRPLLTSQKPLSQIVPSIQRVTTEIDRSGKARTQNHQQPLQVSKEGRSWWYGMTAPFSRPPSAK